MSSGSPWGRRGAIAVGCILFPLLLLLGPAGLSSVSGGGMMPRESTLHPSPGERSPAQDEGSTLCPLLGPQAKETGREMGQTIARAGREILHGLRQSGKETAQALKRAGQQVHRAWREAISELRGKIKKDLTDRPGRK